MTNSIELAIDTIKSNKQTSYFKIICHKMVLANQKAIQCDDACSLWCHIKCDGTTVESYKKIVENEEIIWHCLVCKLKFQHENIPAGLSHWLDWLEKILLFYIIGWNGWKIDLSVNIFYQYH